MTHRGDNRFEPFGSDWQAGTEAGATESGVFLRLPGQWDDDVWADSGGGVYYNVHRWYAPEMAYYTRQDPLGFSGSSGSWYAYAAQAPTVFLDPDGRKTCFVFSLSHIASGEESGLFFVDHVGLYVDSDCGGEGACNDGDRPQRFLYDPSGSYLPSGMNSYDVGSGRVFSEEQPGWDLPAYARYQCTSKKAKVEVVCFQTSCCEEDQIFGAANGGGGGGAFDCANNVSGAIGDTSSFPGGLRAQTRWPRRLRQRALDFFLTYTMRQSYQQLSCGG